MLAKLLNYIPSFYFDVVNDYIYRIKKDRIHITARLSSLCEFDVVSAFIGCNVFCDDSISTVC